MQPIITFTLMFLSGINPGQAQTHVEAPQEAPVVTVSNIPQPGSSLNSGVISALQGDFHPADGQPLCFILKTEVFPNSVIIF